MEDEAVEPEPQPRRSRKAAAEETEPAKPRRSRKAAESEQLRASDEAPKRGRPKKAVELEPAEVSFSSTRGTRTFQAMPKKKEPGEKEPGPGQYYGMHHPQPSALHRAPNPRQAAFDRILSSW